MDAQAARTFPRAQLPGDKLPTIHLDHGGHDILRQVVTLPWRVFTQGDWDSYSGCDSDSPLICQAVVDGLPADCILEDNTISFHWWLDEGAECESFTLHLDGPV